MLLGSALRTTLSVNVPLPIGGFLWLVFHPLSLWEREKGTRVSGVSENNLPV
jgi:hypothetical protein